MENNFKFYNTLTKKIEGWCRMLERSPTRARLLEKKFMFKGNSKTGKTSYVHNRDSQNDGNVVKEQAKQKKSENIKKINGINY